MDLCIFVIRVSKRQLKKLIETYQDQRIIYTEDGVRNYLDVYINNGGLISNYILRGNNPSKTYPNTILQKDRWMQGLAGFLNNALGKGKATYNGPWILEQYSWKG